MQDSQLNCVSGQTIHGGLTIFPVTGTPITCVLLACNPTRSILHSGA